MENTVSIHGSCITRDVFNYITNENIKIKNYIARQSILSSVSIPIKCSDDELKLESNFQKNVVLTDINKLLFRKLESNKSKFFIIDLIDERFRIVKYKQSILTYSNELKRSEFLRGKKYEIINKFNIEDSLIEESINNYICKLLTIYNERSIIIHEAYFLNKYKALNDKIKLFDDNIIKSNDMYNNFLNKCYSCIKKKIPNAYVVNISRYYLADEKNRWGLEPYHYNENYYKDVLYKISKYMNK